MSDVGNAVAAIRAGIAELAASLSSFLCKSSSV